MTCSRRIHFGPVLLASLAISGRFAAFGFKNTRGVKNNYRYASSSYTTSNLLYIISNPWQKSLYYHPNWLLIPVARSDHLHFHFHNHLTKLNNHNLTKININGYKKPDGPRYPCTCLSVSLDRRSYYRIKSRTIKSNPVTFLNERKATLVPICTNPYPSINLKCLRFNISPWCFWFFTTLPERFLLRIFRWCLLSWFITIYCCGIRNISLRQQ